MGRSNRNAWPCKTNRQRLGQTKERNFKCEMARAGTVSIRGREYAKLQLRTVEQILDGQHFDTPPVLGRQQKAQQQLIFYNTQEMKDVSKRPNRRS